MKRFLEVEDIARYELPDRVSDEVVPVYGQAVHKGGGVTNCLCKQKTLNVGELGLLNGVLGSKVKKYEILQSGM